jgi:hypothetical protein
VFGSPLHFMGHAGCLASFASCHPARRRLVLLFAPSGGLFTHQKAWMISLLKTQQLYVSSHLTHIRSSHLEKALAAMQVPFPQLTRLMLDLYDGRCRFFPILSWVDLPSSATPSVGLHTISGITETTPVRYSTRLSSASWHSSRIHSTRGDGHCPLHIDQPRIIWVIFESLRSRPDQATRRPSSLTQRHALSSPFSQSFDSRGSVNNWTTAWLALMPHCPSIHPCL